MTPSQQWTNKSQVRDSDVATNEALLHHAEASRLAKSWLNNALGDGGPSTRADRGGLEKDKDDLEADDKDFARNSVLHSETGGLGFQEAAGSGPASSTRGLDPTTSFLRKQLLRGQARPRPGPGGQRRRRDSSEDEDEGRSGLGKGSAGKSKTRGSPGPAMVDQHPKRSSSGSQRLDFHPEEAHTTVDATATETPRDSARPGKKRGTSYLDEILASRAAKKKKRFSKDNAD